MIRYFFLLAALANIIISGHAIWNTAHGIYATTLELNTILVLTAICFISAFTTSSNQTK
jgi:hypothetical protein